MSCCGSKCNCNNSGSCVSATSDNILNGQLSLGDPDSGNAVPNVQQAINDILASIGGGGGAPITDATTFSSQGTGVPIILTEVVDDLQFKAVAGGRGITLVDDLANNDIIINGPFDFGVFADEASALAQFGQLGAADKGLYAYYNSTLCSLFFWDGSSFSAISSGSGGLETEINQVSHGFSVCDLVYNDGSSWQLADATDSDALAIALVSSVEDSDNFSVQTSGPLSKPGHGLIIGDYYYSDPANPGGITEVEPSTDGEFIVPALHVTSADTVEVILQTPKTVVDSSQGSSSPSPIQVANYFGGFGQVINLATTQDVEFPFGIINGSHIQQETTPVPFVEFTVLENGVYNIYCKIAPVVSSATTDIRFVSIIVLDNSINIGSDEVFYSQSVDTLGTRDAMIAESTRFLAAGQTIKVQVSNLISNPVGTASVSLGTTAREIQLDIVRLGEQ